LIDWSLFQELTQAPGAPGFEKEVRQILRTHLEKYADELVQDRLGGLFGVLRGDDGLRVMVAGHMDEVSFMVVRITEKGFLRFQTLGGWWNQVMLAQRVEVITRTGKRIPGVIGSFPPHLLKADARQKSVEIEDMFIDVGARDKEEVEQMGIRPGDPVVPVCPFIEMEGGRRVMAKAWDNRLGCGLSVELLKEMKDRRPPNTLVAGATVQEEVGLRGAEVAANLIQPDIFIAVDASPAGDIPGVKEGFGELGGGVLIRIYDRTMITLPGMRDYLLDTAEKAKIPYQFFVSSGGTDAGAVHRSGTGVPSAAIGVCARYIHSHAAIVDKEDVEAAKTFLLELVRGLDKNTFEQIRER
jgi:putative aminopeptidase FrvX